MNAKDYQEWTRSVAVYPADSSINYTILGLVGEAGEVADKFKKVLRDNDGVLDHERRTGLIAELGDVAWYLARLADELDVPLEMLFDLNYEKLMSRKDRGKLQGSGDDR